MSHGAPALFRFLWSLCLSIFLLLSLAVRLLHVLGLSFSSYSLLISEPYQPSLVPAWILDIVNIHSLIALHRSVGASISLFDILFFSSD
jgi:hypothetical protein